jgi:hypothetical protein
MGILKTVFLLTAALIIVLLVSRSIRKTVCVVAGYRAVWVQAADCYSKVISPDGSE